MNARTLAKRLQKLEVRYAPSQRMFIRLLFVEPGGEITGEQVIEIGSGTRKDEASRLPGGARPASALARFQTHCMNSATSP